MTRPGYLPLPLVSRLTGLDEETIVLCSVEGIMPRVEHRCGETEMRASDLERLVRRAPWSTLLKTRYVTTEEARQWGLSTSMRTLSMTAGGLDFHSVGDVIAETARERLSAKSRKASSPSRSTTLATSA